MNNHQVKSLEELWIEFVTYIGENRPELLQCKVEAHLQEMGHELLWTPPYCPELKPIYLFWASVKSNVALTNHNDSDMSDVVGLLKEGWCGNYNIYAE